MTEPTPKDHFALPDNLSPEDKVTFAKLFESANKPRETYANPDVQRSLRALLELTPDITDESLVLYPGSASDTSYADVIGRNVIHIDPDTEAIDALEKSGYLAVPSTIEDYLKEHEEPANLVISYNARTVTDELAEAIKPGGYVIANNWHGSANAMSEREDFGILGAARIGNVEVVDPGAAQDMLGIDYKVVTDDGTYISNLEEIAELDPSTYTDLTQPRNSETLWVFQKNA